MAEAMLAARPSMYTLLCPVSLESIFLMASPANTEPPAEYMCISAFLLPTLSMAFLISTGHTSFSDHFSQSDETISPYMYISALSSVIFLTLKKLFLFIFVLTSFYFPSY